MAIGIILFFTMMFAPQAWQFVKIPLVCISVVLLIVHNIIAVRKKISATVLVWFVILLSYGLTWSLIGALKGNIGALDCFRLNVIWAFLYLLFVLYIDSHDKFCSLVNTMVWATIAISIYNIAIVLSALGFIPNINEYLKVDSEVTSLIGIHSGFIQLTSINIGSLTFLAPFVLVLLIMDTRLPDTISSFVVSKKILLLSVLLSIVAVLISGRRVLYVEMLVIPFLVLVLNIYSAGENRKIRTKNIIVFYSITIVVLAACGWFLSNRFDWNINMFNERFVSAFESEGVRHEQALALFNGFSEHPLIGVGFGEGVPDVIRSDERPWTYELSYSVILYTTGILGSTLYLVCILTIYYLLIRALKNRLSNNEITTSVLVAFTCFLIGNATNPYLGSYDFMWMFYLPMAYIGAIKSEQNNMRNDAK